MTVRFRDRFMPTAVGLVSRAWVVEEVERRVEDPVRRAALVEQLVVYEPPRQHALRNGLLFWALAIGASQLALALDLPAWTGFACVVSVFVVIARWLATMALRWRLQQLLDAGSGVADDA